MGERVELVCVLIDAQVRVLNSSIDVGLGLDVIELPTAVVQLTVTFANESLVYMTLENLSTVQH